MAIRRPSVFRQDLFVFQDFLYNEEIDGEELRYVLAKYDGEPYEVVPQTFDYPIPEFKGGDIIARIDYTIVGKLIVIDHWEVNWRDEWPLRLSVQFLVHCLYPSQRGYVVTVSKEAYPFWVSENFFPITNDPNDYLVQAPYGNS
jgi:hypothetical protein